MVEAIKDGLSFSGGLCYCAVSNVNTRLSEKLEKEREIRRGIQGIMVRAFASQAWPQSILQESKP